MTPWLQDADVTLYHGDVLAVLRVARKLGRHAVGIDLNVEYLELAARRLQQQSLFADAL